MFFVANARSVVIAFPECFHNGTVSETKNGFAPSSQPIFREGLFGANFALEP
jgi:hypothetical protein